MREAEDNNRVDIRRSKNERERREVSSVAVHALIYLLDVKIITQYGLKLEKKLMREKDESRKKIDERTEYKFCS